MKLYTTFNKHIKEIPADELKEAFRGCNKSFIMRSIIMNEKDFLPKNTEERSLRRVWYATVKPTLDKLGLLTEKDMSEDGLSNWDVDLSRYAVELVRKGLVTYSALRIMDTSRQRNVPTNSFCTVSSRVYGYQVGTAQCANVILCTEKDTAFGLVERIASLYGCSCLSGKGQNAFAATESLLIDMDAGRYSDIYILTMTDYDPSGFYISDTFRKQVEAMKPVLGITARVHTERLGITPCQLTETEIQQNMYSPKTTNLDKWMKATGGINGQPKGLELDALPDQRLREIFVTSLKKYIDGTVYEDMIKDAYIRQVMLSAIKDYIDDMARNIIGSIRDKITVRNFDMARLALQGYSHLPIAQLCNDDNDSEIAEMALDYFK